MLILHRIRIVQFAIRVLAVRVPPSLPLPASNLIESTDLDVVGSSLYKVSPFLLYLLPSLPMLSAAAAAALNFKSSRPVPFYRALPIPSLTFKPPFSLYIRVIRSLIWWRWRHYLLLSSPTAAAVVLPPPPLAVRHHNTHCTDKE